MGFSLVVEELIKAKKPIIGHNMIYDIAYLYNQFIDNLPKEYCDFIKRVRFLNIGLMGYYSLITYSHKSTTQRC